MQDLATILDREQHYVCQFGQPFSLKLVQHPSPTINCADKLQLLQQRFPDQGWTAERVVKTLYLRQGRHVIGIIAPGYERLPLTEILHEALGIPYTEARSYRLSTSLPQGMEPGTCTPFPLYSSVGYDIHQLLVLDVPTLPDQQVDISLGGKGPDAHKRSLHLPYRAIFPILQQEFGDYAALVKRGGM